MLQLVWYVLAWVVKNLALIVGILEALCKVIVGIISLTPTKRDDACLDKVNMVFSTIKRWLYTLSDWTAGKEIPW